MLNMIRNAENDPNTSLRDVTGAVKYATDIMRDMIQLQQKEEEIKYKHDEVTLIEENADDYDDNFYPAMTNAINSLATANIDVLIETESLIPLEDKYILNEKDVNDNV